MFQFIVKSFIKDYDNTSSSKVREKYGILCSILSIICNIIMVIFKLIFGTLVHSVSIVADGYNNLSDVGSNIATLFGFKLSNMHPDSDHPYGHGRYEYISGLIISFLIILVGITSLKESVTKIFQPEIISFNIYAVIVLVASICMKLWMAFFNNKTAKLISSSALLAAGQDSLNDVLTTSATLITLIASLFTTLPVDGVIGLLVSLIVVKGGIEIARETINPLLGQAPDKELVHEIEDYILSFDKVIGIHDLMMHDYGPGRRYMSLHAEVSSKEDIMALHDEIDVIEGALLRKYNILTTIHMDPIDQDDKLTNELREKVSHIVVSINPSYSIHDFRLVTGPTHTNLIFDVLLPSEDRSDHSVIRNKIEEEVKKMNSNYYCVMQIEHGFI